MSVIYWIILGLVAGFVASKLVSGQGKGPIVDIALGIVGAVAGGWLFSVLGMSGISGFNIYSLVVAIVGAIALLLVYHVLVRLMSKNHQGTPKHH